MPSENIEPSAAAAVSAPSADTGDRRTRKRVARREHLLDLAADLVEDLGVGGVTMAALAEAADYAPASLYTYFESRSALMAAIQERALVTLGQVAETHLATTASAVAATTPAPSPAVAALARLCAFSDLFLAAPRTHPREFRLQQDLLVTTEVEDAADAGRLVPLAMHVLDAPRRLLAVAVDAGALTPGGPTADPLGLAVDSTLTRTLAWVVALNGALLTDRLVTGLPTTGTALGDALTDALLVGWGARPADLDAARALAGTWRTDPSGPASEGQGS